MPVTADVEFLVRVRAQVMMRDDSTGGWVPLGGGGLSWVAVKKRALETITSQHQRTQQQQQCHLHQQSLDHHPGGGPGGASSPAATSPAPGPGPVSTDEAGRMLLEDGRCDEDRGQPRCDEDRGQPRCDEDRGQTRDSQCCCQYEYLIVGRRISDDHDVLSCTIKRDFEYNRVMPTFHHWRTGNKKFGLTFQTAADARTFDKGITAAVEDLLNDVTEKTPLQSHGDGDGDVFMMLELPLERDVSSSGTPANRSPHKSLSPPVPGSPHHPMTSSPLPHSPPVPPSSSQPASPIPPARLTPTLSSPLHGGDSFSLNQQTTQRLTRSRTVCGSSAGGRGRGSLRATGLPLGDPPPPGDNIYEWLEASEKLPPLRTYNSETSNHSEHDKYCMLQPHISLLDRGDCVDSVSDTYVRFDIKDQDPQYHYPNLDSLANVLPSPDKNGRRSSLSSLKRQTAAFTLEDTFTFQGKEKGKKRKGKKSKKNSGMRVRCAHCQDLYIESENKRGSCSYSPDAVRQGIECVSCLACAKCLLYHCHYEDENFSEEEICTCTDTDGHLTQRWIGLSLLAVLVPCLCLYPMLTACYTCARACHVCGGKHVPV